MRASPYAPADLAEGVLTIRLQVNTMNNLMDLLSFVQADEAVNVIVLRNEGEQFGESLGAAADTDPELSHQLVQRLRDLPQPIVAMVPGHIHDQALALLQACDIVLATGQDDWATLSFPAPELEEQTYKLAHELASKDPLILRFTKKTGATSCFYRLGRHIEFHDCPTSRNQISPSGAAAPLGEI